MDIDREAKKVMGIEGEDEEVEKEYSWDFTHTDERGHVYAGRLTNRILTNNMRVEVAILKARMRGGLPAAAFDEEHNFWLNCIAHITVSLGGERPDWAQNLGTLTDDSLAVAIWQEVAKHEARFWGRDKGQKAGAGGSGGKGGPADSPPSVGAP